MNDTELLRILIVDDHAMVRSGLEDFVSAFEWMEVVGEARNGAEAVEFCAAQDVDVVLMDMVMPVMDGSEATRRIMALAKPVKITAASSSSVALNELKSASPGLSATISAWFCVLSCALSTTASTLAFHGSRPKSALSAMQSLPILPILSTPYRCQLRKSYHY